MLDFLKDNAIPLWIKIIMFVVVAEVLRRIFSSQDRKLWSKIKSVTKDNNPMKVISKDGIWKCPSCLKGNVEASDVCDQCGQRILK